MTIKAGRGFNLHAPEDASIVEDKVVLPAVSPGFRDPKAEAGRLVHESHFGQLSLALGLRTSEMFWRANRAGNRSRRVFIHGDENRKGADPRCGLRLSIYLHYNKLEGVNGTWEPTLYVEGN